jgi:uncharacterized membrane protein (DUF373 family)
MSFSQKQHIRPFTFGNDVLKILGKFEMVVIGLLITMMVFIILVSTIRLGWTMSQELIKSHTLLLDSQQLFKLFGFILMIILGLEILDSIKAYITEDQIHVEVVFTIALISIAKTIITTDLKTLPPLTLVGLASVIISLALGYFFIKKIHQTYRLSALARDDKQALHSTSSKEMFTTDY